ncbi:uncharacterized protein LOC135700694 [Ochlerotatus camptorhynchus]|uniref:uncharacterized protein LOC135700694 n=1 Tax=Ochlerotatus camptorhynchus TaxID=644619 RepID=UPI0031DE8F6F
MEEQVDCFEQLQAFHLKNDSIRQISQEPERIEDEVFVRICSSCDGIGIGQLASVLQPLLEKMRSTAGCDGNRSQVEMTTEKGTTLKEIISEVLLRIDEFRSLDQYIWLLKFSCCLCLLKDLPIGMSFEINKVIRSVAELDTEEYEFDPLMIHTITKSLFEEIPLEGMNLVHVVKKLTVLNQKLFYYVSIALVFAGIRHYSHPDEPIAMYRLYGFGDVLTKLEALKIDNIKQTLDLRKLFLILKLLSCYQNAVILRHNVCSLEDVQEQHQCFAEFFRFTLAQKKAFTQWLCMARNVVTNLNSKSGMQEIELKEDFLLVIELIDLDMIALMEDDLDEVKE